MVDRMKKRLSMAKAPLPKFRSDMEVAEYFEAHSVAELWDHLPESQRVKLSAALGRTIRARHVVRGSNT